MAFDHQLGEGDVLSLGTTRTSSSFDPIILVIATASGCLFVTLVISCVCCSRKPERRSRNANRYSRRDTVPLEDLLSKPTLADPESFFSEAVLDDKDPPHVIGYRTSNDDTSVASMSQMSDLSTSELVGIESGQNQASMLERKCKSEKVKRSKNFQNRMLNNELRPSAKESRRQSDHILDNTTQNNARIIINDTQVDRLRDDDFLYKNNDFDYVNEINNTSSKRGNLDNKLKKTDNKDPSSTERSLDVTTMAEDRVSSESFTSSARGSISHDMTASVNVLRLPRQSLIPQADSWSGNLLEEPERSTLPEVKEIPSTPTDSPPVQFSISGQKATVENSQSMESTTKRPENDTASKSPQDASEGFVDNGNPSGAYSVEIRPHIQENPTLTHSPESSQPVQSNCKNADQTNGRIPERISLNLQIDFHFSDKAGCCGNQTRSYVVCSPVSVSQEMRGVSSSRVDTITTSSSTGKQPFHETQNTIPDNTNCAIVRAGGHMSEELQPHMVIDNTNNHSMSRSELNCETKRAHPCIRTLDVSRKRFSTPIDFVTARGLHGIELHRIEKRRFTVSDVADIEVILKERKLVQLPGSEICHHPSNSERIDMDTEKMSLSNDTNDSHSRLPKVLASSQASHISSNTECNQDQQKDSNLLSQESHPSNAINDTEQIEEHLTNSKISSQESHLQKLADNYDLDRQQQECCSISSHDPILGKGNEWKSNNQNEIIGNVSLIPGSETDVVDTSSNHDSVCVPNQANENSRFSNEGSEGFTQEKQIAVRDSISDKKMKDCNIIPLNIDTETRMEEMPSNLTPLNASILEDDEDIMLQSKEEPVRIGISAEEEEIQSKKAEQKDGHFNLMPFVANEEHVKENENGKHLNVKRRIYSERDTPVDPVKKEKAEKDDEMLKSRQYIPEKETRSERHGYMSKDGTKICSITDALESKRSNDVLKEKEKNGKTGELTPRHDYTCEDGARICSNDAVFIVVDSEGQNHTPNGENRGATSEDVKSRSDMAGTKKEKMTGSKNTNEIAKIISNENDKTAYKLKPSCGESEMTQETHDQAPGDTEIKASDSEIAANYNRNISTCNHLVENNCLNTKTKRPAEEAEHGELLGKDKVPQQNFKPSQERQGTREKQKEMCKTQFGDESKQITSHETEIGIVSKPVQKDIRENTFNTSPTRLRDEKLFDWDDPKYNNETEEKPQLKGILRVNRSIDMTFKEQDNFNMNFYPIQNTLASCTGKGHSQLNCHQNIAPFVFVSKDINVDKPAKIESGEGSLSPILSLPPAEDNANASDESDYDNPWDSLDEAVKRGSMRYNRRASRVADGSDAKTLMLKSAEDLGRLLEDAERRRRMRQNAARSSCQITDTTPPSPPPTFTRLSPFRHTVKGLVSHGSSNDLQDDALKSHPIKGKKDLQRSKDDLSPGFTGGIDPNRAKTLTSGERSKIYSPETKKRKGLLHRK